MSNNGSQRRKATTPTSIWGARAAFVVALFLCMAGLHSVLPTAAEQTFELTGFTFAITPAIGGKNSKSPVLIIAEKASNRELARIRTLPFGSKKVQKFVSAIYSR